MPNRSLHEEVESDNRNASPCHSVTDIASFEREITDRFGLRFKECDDGARRTQCPVCEAEEQLQVGCITDTEVGYTCVACGISGFTLEHLLDACISCRDEPWDLLDPKQVPADRVQALKECAAEHCHSTLLQVGSQVRLRLEQGPVSAIDYLTKIRGHSLETLQEFRVGLSLDRLYEHAVSQGYRHAELVAAGLLKESCYEYWPPGLILFPHVSNGRVSHFSQKDVTGEVQHQSKNEHRSPGVLWFNQDASVDAVELVCVEGEHDVLSVAGKAEYENVIGSNGSVSNQQIQFLTELPELQRLVLCFDSDANGYSYTRKVARAFADSEKHVTVQMIRLPDGCKDIDEFLRKSDDPAASFGELLKNASLVRTRKSPSTRCRAVTCTRNGRSATSLSRSSIAYARLRVANDI